MTSPTDPDPTIRRRLPVPVTRVLAGGQGVALVLVLSTLTAVAAPRGLPQLPAPVVLRVADRSSDPLANAPLRGRVSPSQSMLPAGEAPLRGRAAGAGPAPAHQAPAEVAPVAPPVAAEPAPGGTYGLRQRTAQPERAPAPIRSVMPYNPSGAASSSPLAPPQAAAAPPAPVSGVSATRGTLAGRNSAPIPAGEAASAVSPPPVAAAGAGPVVEQIDVEIGPVAAAPVAGAAAPAASGTPVWAIRQADGSLLLNWTVPGRQISDPFLVSIIGPDEHTSLRTVRTNGAGWTYSPEAQLIDFGLPITDRLCVRVRSASDGAGGLNIAPICIQVSPAS